MQHLHRLDCYMTCLSAQRKECSAERQTAGTADENKTQVKEKISGYLPLEPWVI